MHGSSRDSVVGRAGLHAGAAGHALRIDERLVRRRPTRLAVEAAALDGQREGALHFLAGPHAARADDAFGRIESEIRIRFVAVSRPLVSHGRVRRHRQLHVAHARAGRTAARHVTCRIRSRHWRRRSGSRAGGRRCRAPSRRLRICFSRSVWVDTTMPGADRRGARRRRAGACPWISTRQSRQEPKASTDVRGAELWAPGSRLSIAARMIEVPAGTADAAGRRWSGSPTLAPICWPACRNRVLR